MAGSRRRWWRWIAIGTAVLIVAALAAPFLVPLSGFIPQLEALAAQGIGQPVAIAELKLHLLPTPRATATDVRVGKRNEVRAGELQIVPELLPLIVGQRSVRLIRAENVVVKEAALSFPDKMPKSDQPVEIRRVVLRAVKLEHSALRLPEFDLDVELGEGLSVVEALFKTRDGALKVSAEPAGEGSANLRLEASKWRLPLAAVPLRFDSLKASGTLKGKRLELPKIEGKLYGGTLAGSARADWAKLWQVSGKTDLAGVDVAPVQQALGKPVRLTGKLDAKTTYSASARAAAQLASALMLDGPFEVKGGAYQGVDLTKVGDLVGSKGAGGSTRFDELTGKLQVRGRNIKVNELCARSPALVAGGNVEVAPDDKLSGRLDVSVVKTKGFVGVPVALAGTTSNPIVTPTKGYTIGAVVGTVLLPGVGTALGGTAGGALEGKSGCK